jgi:hypothetical protein
MSFESITSKYPSEQEALSKLRNLLSSPRAGEFTLNRLCELVAPNDRDEFAIILGDLARNGLVKLIVRVVSPSTQGGVGDYSTLDEVPKVVHDRRTDTALEVTSENLRIIYKAA